MRGGRRGVGVTGAAGRRSPRGVRQPDPAPRCFRTFSGCYPYAFWFKPSEGTLDPLFARALVVEGNGARVAWATVDLVAVDRGFTQEVGARLRAAGVAPASLIISASHTHSGPGAFGDSGLWAFLAVDRLDAAVRSALATPWCRRSSGRRPPR